MDWSDPFTYLGIVILIGAACWLVWYIRFTRRPPG